MQKADVYVITRNINSGAQVGSISYQQNGLTPDQQKVYDNFNKQKSVRQMIAEDRKQPPYNADGERINDADQNEGALVGNSWKDGQYGEATIKLDQSVVIPFIGGTNKPAMSQFALNTKLASIGQILNLFPNSSATITGNTGNPIGGNMPTGNAPAILTLGTSLNGQPSNLGQLMLARGMRLKEC